MVRFMGWGVVGLNFWVSVSALAAPAYFADPINGYFISSLSGRDATTVKPGTITDCKITYQSATYTGWTCVPTGAEMTIAAGGKNMTVTFDKLHVSEFIYKEGSSMSYLLSGPYTEKLPDGTTLETNVALNFDQGAKKPTHLNGKINMGSYASGAFVAQIPPPAP